MKLPFRSDSRRIWTHDHFRAFRIGRGSHSRNLTDPAFETHEIRPHVPGRSPVPLRLRPPASHRAVEHRHELCPDVDDRLVLRHCRQPRRLLAHRLDVHTVSVFAQTPALPGLRPGLPARRTYRTGCRGPSSRRDLACGE